MNTRGLTEIVVLNIGLRAGIIDHQLYSLMVIMALVTTVMTGPLLTAIRAHHPAGAAALPRSGRARVAGSLRDQSA